MERKHKSATLRDIAEQAGCSANTASLALRNSRRISDATRKRIHRIAKKLGYIPNLAGRNLRIGRSGIIGVYTRSLYDAVRTELVNNILAELHAAGYRPVLGLGEGHCGPWHLSPWMQTYRELNIEAMVVVAEAVVKLPRWPRRIPTILVGCQPAESLRCDYLALDRKAGARMGIEHLVARGQKRILVACNEKSVFAKGCFEAMTDAGIRSESVCVDYPCGEEQKTRLLGHLAKQRGRPTAIIFGDSPLAVEFMHWLPQAGIKIPRDLAIVGYDYFPWAGMLKVPLTTIEQPISELVVGAVNLVKNRLTRPDSQAVHTVLPHKLVVRKSSRTRPA